MIGGALPEALQELLPQELQRLCRPLLCVRGDVLFKQGKKPAHMLFVRHGEVVL